MGNDGVFAIYYATSRGLGLFSVFVEAFRISGEGKWKDDTSYDLGAVVLMTLVPLVGDLILLMFVPSILVLQPLDRWFTARSIRVVMARQKKHLEEQEKDRVLSGKTAEELLSKLESNPNPVHKDKE